MVDQILTLISSTAYIEVCTPHLRVVKIFNLYIHELAIIVMYTYVQVLKSR